MSRPEPISPDRLPDVLAGLLVAAADRIRDDPGGTPAPGVLRVLVDGAPAAGGTALADALVDPLRLRGRPALRVSAGWFLRPASVRLEHGRTDPDAYYEGWLDAKALRREVLDPLGPDGSGRYLPTLWDPATDRATRAPYETAAAGAVLLLDGPLLLGQGLPAELSVHLRLSPAGLERRTPEPDRWTLPAYRRYAEEVAPESLADIVIRMEDPRHPAMIVQGVAAGG